MTEKELKKLTKVELLDIGLVQGIELDSNNTKSDLVKQIAAFFIEEETFHEADTNKDGVISAEEAAAFKELQRKRNLGYC